MTEYQLSAQVIAMKTEMDIQFRELFNRTKRLETILIACSAAIIALLLKLVMAA
jgi:hypothetical protein